VTNELCADDERIIVAELSKHWIDGQEVRPDLGLLSQQFENVIAQNAARGYRLLNFLHRLMTREDELNETIIAVFERVTPAADA